jgi:hypothetical protein
MPEEARQDRGRGEVEEERILLVTCNRRIGSNEPEIDGYQEPRRSIDSGEPEIAGCREPRRSIDSSEPEIAGCREPRRSIDSGEPVFTR